MLQIDVSAIRKELLIERQEAVRMMRQTDDRNAKRAWYYTYRRLRHSLRPRRSYGAVNLRFTAPSRAFGPPLMGALEFAYSIGGITREQFRQEEEDFEKAVEACWDM